jgi:hypothetical protein
VANDICQIKKRTLVNWNDENMLICSIGVMPREAADCTTVLTELLLHSSSKASSQFVWKFTAYDGTRKFVSVFIKAF